MPLIIEHSMRPGKVAKMAKNDFESTGQSQHQVPVVLDSPFAALVVGLMDGPLNADPRTDATMRQVAVPIGPDNSIAAS